MTIVTPKNEQAISMPPRNCTFHHNDWEILSKYWYPVALISEIEDKPVGVTLLDEALVVYRSGEEIIVAYDLCPHRGVPLSAGTGNGEAIACAYHGIQFGAKGKCIHVPAHPDSKIPERLHLRTYPVILRYGLVWASLYQDINAETLPVMQYWDESGFEQINCPGFDIAAFAGRQIEGFIDVAHFAFVHEATFADPHNTVVPEYTPVNTSYGFTADYFSTVSNYTHDSGKKTPEGFLWLRHFELFTPFTATLAVHFPDNSILNIMNAASPVSARKTRLFVPIARNYDLHIPASVVQEFNRKIFDEDRVIVEMQKPENLPLDPRIEVNIPADRSSVAYRRTLKNIGLSEFFTA